MLNRRSLLAAVPGLLLAGRASIARAGDAGIAAQAGFQAALAPFWDQLAMLPSIREPAREAPSDGICYMFTNKDCAVCQVVHQQFPDGFRKLEMRYVVYPWPGEPYRELNYLYRPETTLAEYRAYMDRRLNATVPSDSGAQVDLVMAVAADMAAQLVEGGGFGTPFFFHAVEGATPGRLLFSAGDIVAMGPLLDRAA
ncbi:MULTISPECIES: permease [unclassified Sphingomonas]|uniref:permease n=1 Tax=unclassified Sphingomonas TaxID=196159 RepID=UPI000A6425A0|nr:MULTISPECIES: permease [unclassified Sphingomonas]